MQFSDVMRVIGTHLSVPEVTLKKEDRTIILIGMMHTAPVSFFTTIRERLLTLEENGFQVLYEAIDPSWPEPVTDEQRMLHEHAYEQIKAWKNRLLGIGFAYQLDEIPILDSWYSADFSLEDWTRENPTRGPTQESVDRFERQPLDANNFIKDLIDTATQLESKKFSSSHLEKFVTRRDKHASKIILGYAENKNVVTFWGSAHLPGIEFLLAEAGYKAFHLDWIPVLDVTTYKAERE
ncbi:MAG: hypothetical protein JWM39_94 [Parcubacteria group bacterium]|nr:hypothetical protein [Parcubacteria group bacterium]